MIWFAGFILFVSYRVFNAGMNTKTLFYRDQVYSFEGKGPHFDDNKLMIYAGITFGVGITWPIAMPLIGIYLLGKRYGKKEKV